MVRDGAHTHPPPAILASPPSSARALCSATFQPCVQLVFHFARYEEAKRMVAVMDIAVLLERLRDAFLADKNSLVGRNGSLPFHFMNDIDMAFRVRTLALRAALMNVWVLSKRPPLGFVCVGK